MIYNNSYKNGSILSRTNGDVNGDKIIDNIYLIGLQSLDSPLTQNIRLVIQDGATGVYYNIPIKENIGYDPQLFLGDFTGDGIDDILISIATGGSGGIYNYYIYSFVHNSVNLLFDSEVYNNQYKYSVNYKDNYKVAVISNNNEMRYLIDISLRDVDYLREIYDESGDLLEPIEGWVNPMSGLYPIDFDYNKVFELLAFQKIAGRYNADSLGYVQNTFKWNNNAFDLDRQEVSIFGQLKNNIKGELS